MNESWQYLNYLKELQCQRKMNEAQLDQLLAELNFKMVKQDNARCAEQIRNREFEKV